MLLARFLFQEASLFRFFLFEKLVGNSFVHFWIQPVLPLPKRCFCPTCPSPPGGSLTHSQALALSKRARDVTAPPVALNRCALRLAGHQSPRQVSCAGWDRMANEKGTSASIAVQYRLTHQHTKRYLLHIPYLQVCTKINHFF